MIEFAAVIAYTGMEARGGWYLAPLEEGAKVPLVRRLPLPVTGLTEAGHGRIGYVEHVTSLRDAVVARGFIDNTPAGRDYAGSLRLGLTRMVMEGETAQWLSDEEEEGAVRCEEWQVHGASVQRAESAAWDLPRPQIEMRGLT